MLAEAIVSVFLIISVTSIQLAFIKNVTFVPASDYNNTVIANGTCFECLCQLVSSSYAALNCLPNNACLFITTFPSRYQLQQTSEALLYFPNQSLPEPSQCCMPDITLLLSKLRNSTATYTNISSPRSLLLDNQGYLSTVSYQEASLYRFNLSSLDRINFIYHVFFKCGLQHVTLMEPTMSDSAAIILRSLTVAVESCWIPSHRPLLNGPRDIIFLNGGQTMVVTSVSNNYLIFFNRTNTAPVNYTVAYYQSVSYSQPHGLWRVNDTLFYVTAFFTEKVVFVFDF